MIVEEKDPVTVSTAADFDRQFIFDIEMARETFPA
jgi:hypothetical protein